MVQLPCFPCIQDAHKKTRPGKKNALSATSSPLGHLYIDMIGAFQMLVKPGLDVNIQRFSKTGGSPVTKTGEGWQTDLNKCKKRVFATVFALSDMLIQDCQVHVKSFIVTCHSSGENPPQPQHPGSSSTTWASTRHAGPAAGAAAGGAATADRLAGQHGRNDILG